MIIVYEPNVEYPYIPSAFSDVLLVRHGGGLWLSGQMLKGQPRPAHGTPRHACY